MSGIVRSQSKVEIMRSRALREAQVEAQRLVEATDAALAADGDLLDDAERAELDTLLIALRKVAQSDDADTVETATKALAAGTDEFAARRMNKGIRRALAGRKLDEIVSSMRMVAEGIKTTNAAVDLAKRHNVATDGNLRIPSAYLSVLAIRA